MRKQDDAASGSLTDRTAGRFFAFSEMFSGATEAPLWARLGSSRTGDRQAERDQDTFSKAGSPAPSSLGTVDANHMKEGYVYE